MKTLNKLLVANRGEIAVRIMQTAHRMGLGTVAVFSDPDTRAAHVRAADEAVRIDSYLNVESILRAAKLTGADSIHPGYGFLSERHEFAQAVVDAGLTFVGPSPSAIRAMGLKREAKAIAAKHGVSLVPGADGGDQSTETIEKQALELGLPIILKPSAGGGGKGMFVVRNAHELKDAIEAARRSALAAFGDGTLILEKFLERPRHVEVQVLGDAYGNLVHLYERECSVQRRHQKIVEEAPCSWLGDDARKKLAQSALEVAKAISYTNAGTVEFLVDADGRAYFSEMNTRLQVEHRVTEKILGLDLVELQLRIARGEPLPFRQQDLKTRGHAVEVRICAEDPSNEFLPSTGTLQDFHVHPVGDVLVDSGFATGDEISVHYDSLLAKVIAWGDDRVEATRKMVRALQGLSIQGVTTNRAFVAQLLQLPAYANQKLHIGFVDEHGDAARSDPHRDEKLTLAARAATLAGVLERNPQDALLPGFRNNRFRDAAVTYDTNLRVEYRLESLERVLVDREPWTVVSWESPVLTVITPDGLRQRLRITRSKDDVISVHTRFGDVTLKEHPQFPRPSDEATRGGLIAPMPGKVVKVLVSAGQTVAKGAPLVVLEAMKMEQTTRSPTAGTVREICVKEGAQIPAGQVLVVLDAAE